MENSPILDFYPSSFQIDMNGKKMAWQGVALLPFIDEKRLLDTMAPEYENLTEDEKRRNAPGNNVIFAAEGHPVFPFYEALYGKKKLVEVCRCIVTTVVCVSRDPHSLSPSMSAREKAFTVSSCPILTASRVPPTILPSLRLTAAPTSVMTNPFLFSILSRSNSLPIAPFCFPVPARLRES
jgi:5'-3' exonuclease